MIVDITKTAIPVYRVCSDDGEVHGYALTVQEDAVSEPITCIDETLDSVRALQVHVFGCKTAARAFQEGLILGGGRAVRLDRRTYFTRLGGAAGVQLSARSGRSDRGGHYLPVAGRRGGGTTGLSPVAPLTPRRGGSLPHGGRDPPGSGFSRRSRRDLGERP